MDEKTEAVWQFLRHHYVGRDRACTRDKILEHYNEDARAPLADRDFREIVSTLVSTYRKPICTLSRGGYFVAHEQEEIAGAVSELRVRAQRLLSRASALAVTDPEKVQTEMF